MPQGGSVHWILDSACLNPRQKFPHFLLVSLDIIIPSAEPKISAYPTHFTILMTAFRRGLCLGEQVCCNIWIDLLHLRCRCWGRRALARFLFLTTLFQQLFLTAESIYYIYVSRNQIRCVLIISTLRSDGRESPEVPSIFRIGRIQNVTYLLLSLRLRLRADSETRVTRHISQIRLIKIQ